MFNLRGAVVTQSHFYQEVKCYKLEGMQQEKANLMIRLLIHRCGNFSSRQLGEVPSLYSLTKISL